MALITTCRDSLGNWQNGSDSLGIECWGRRWQYGDEVEVAGWCASVSSK